MYHQMIPHGILGLMARLGLLWTAAPAQALGMLSSLFIAPNRIPWECSMDSLDTMDVDLKYRAYSSRFT